MIGLGTIINSVAIAAGGIAGRLFGRYSCNQLGSFVMCGGKDS